MIDRGFIKWQPFNSVFSTQKIIKDIAKERDKIDMPSLSEDQLKIIEETINDAYILKTKIHIKYYYNGNIENQTGNITYINKNQKKICLNNKYIYFKQIIKVYF